MIIMLSHQKINLITVNNSFDLLFHFISYIFFFHIVMTLGMLYTIIQNFFFCFTFYDIITIKSSFSTTNRFHKLSSGLFPINNFYTLSGFPLAQKYFGLNLVHN